MVSPCQLKSAGLKVPACTSIDRPPVGAIKAYRHVSDNDYHFNPSAAGVLPHLVLYKHRPSPGDYQGVQIELNVLIYNILF
ncbi:hypothetical protein J4734_18295 [Klebsiella pneumoniae]|uniref:Uncharacterized protein n=1 Tax=Klebsiella pneumoniae TaxID=573 RepID=A0A939SUM4_KLEPN|nr:hypothetical protein [Klebsiella pneumoniae]